ncbi:uncharacterized protein LTR77_009718 [Saxophila tyrrhenica]|uniref:Oxidoreductase n=1 Tax=Saxophila tyrrhenica TaxID=1690608 RepID=A0AAV9P0H3_9PEZI|nr:hypothetical protein LTR77_009718 [Saxophila tyrrhenica]
MKYNPERDIPDLSGKVILITGGTAGIGKAAVFELAKHSPEQIYFTGRNAQAGAGIIAEAKQSSPRCAVTFIKCDLSASREDIRNSIQDQFKSSRLDILIANAGIMAVPPALGAEGFEIQFTSNYLGHAILLKLLRPLMVKTAKSSPDSDARLVMLSSFGHTVHLPGGIDFDSLRTPDAGTALQRYGQSKLADILLAKSMAKHYPQITSVSVHPGLVRTNLADNVEPSFMFSILTSLTWTPLYSSAEQGAYNALWAATAPKGSVENGAYYDPVGKKAGKKGQTSGLADAGRDKDLAERLWKWTEDELKGLEDLS